MESLSLKSSLHTHLLSLWKLEELGMEPVPAFVVRLVFVVPLVSRCRHRSTSFSLLQSEPPVAHGFESEGICKWFFGGTCDTESLFRSPFPLKAKRPFLSVGG